ncbi:MAG: NAD(P)-binding domain-containing protein [Candidatus Binatia bacterium]
MSGPTLIVGAGPGGLAVARAFKLFGVPYVQVERHSDLGGIWDADNPGSPIYESAHFISSKTCSAFHGLPMPDAFPDYPGRLQILEYLRAFADTFGLRDGLHFRTEVTSAAPLPGVGWNVTFADGTTSEHCAIVATVGAQWLPVMPSYPGTFTGELLHSAAYWSSESLRGRRVLVIGGGNSGFDIACDAAKVAARAALSVRRGYWVFPKHLFGQPVDAFIQQGPHLPNWLGQPLLVAILRLAVGRQDRFGLRAPDHKPLESHPVLNTQVFHYLSHGDLAMKPDVSRFDGEVVHFADGTSEAFDVVLCATGFRHEVPFLPPATIAATRSGRPRLITGAFVPGRTDLFVPGMFETNSGGYMLYDKLAFLVAQTVRDLGDSARADRVRSEIQKDLDLSGGLRFVDSPRTEDYVDATALARRIESVARELDWQLPTQDGFERIRVRR